MSAVFSELADVWLEHACYQSPSAMHGWLAGFVASGGRIIEKQHVATAIDYLELPDEPTDALLATVKAVYEQVLADLSKADLSFVLLLPEDEDADVDEQVDCLAQWSKGFLDGFGASGAVKGQLSADVVEMLGDFDAFSQAEVEDPTDAQNAELFVSLSEHARMAAQSLFLEFNAHQAPQKGDVVH